MNTKTRKELNKLADLLSEDGNLDGALETNTFTNLAIHLADKNNIALSAPTIKLYEEWLRCKVFDILDECDLEDCEEDVLDELFGGSDDTYHYTPLYDEEGYEVDWSVMLDNLKAIINRLERASKGIEVILPSSSKAKKIYTVFDEKGDSVVVTRGAYSKPPFAGMTPKEINEMRGWPCMAGWADGLLTENEKLGRDRVGSLTNDDIEVLNKIKKNEI